MFVLILCMHGKQPRHFTVTQQRLMWKVIVLFVLHASYVFALKRLMWNFCFVRRHDS